MRECHTLTSKNTEQERGKESSWQQKECQFTLRNKTVHANEQILSCGTW